VKGVLSWLSGGTLLSVAITAYWYDDMGLVGNNDTVAGVVVGVVGVIAIPGGIAVPLSDQV
jgi:hypothetical protein